MREPIDAGVTPAVVAIEPSRPPVAIEPDVPPDTPATCDIAPFLEASDQLFQAGTFAAALVKLEAALKCKPGDQRILALAFIAACEIKNTPKQKHFYERMSKQTRDRVVQRCFPPKPPPDDFPIP